MKQFNTFFVTVIALLSFQVSQAQLCDGVKGPNLLGAKGTFSPPFITINDNADTCLTSGSKTYNPKGNVGNKLEACATNTSFISPCSDYNYSDKKNGMQAEFTYSILKVMGDENGSNCLHDPIWKAKDHTGDNGYFMAVNGAPNTNFSPVFYRIKQIPVCPGTTYEFSAWVINMMPAGGDDGSAPNITFTVNGTVIGNSGPIPYDNQWHEVGGSFVATTSFVDLEVRNNTQVAGGNDLGLDDISFRVCQSQILVNAPDVVAEGSEANPQFTVSDPLKENTWYKWQISIDGGDADSYMDITNGEQAVFGSDNKFTVSPYEYIGPAYPEMMGYRYRLVVSTSQIGLDNPQCIYVNDFRLIVGPAEGPLPITLTSFDGTYSNGTANLKWQTSQEINNDRFEILRSFNGSDFELVGKVAGAGNSNLKRDYTYQDRVSSASGHVFYKLRQVDKDGRFSFSSVVKLTMNDVAASFRLFPNPVVNNFTASFSAPKATSATLMIRNVSGQTVYSKTVNVLKGNNSVVVDNAPLKTGMYYVTITGEDINYKGKLQKQ